MAEDDDFELYGDDDYDECSRCGTLMRCDYCDEPNQHEAHFDCPACKGSGIKAIWCPLCGYEPEVPV